MVVRPDGKVAVTFFATPSEALRSQLRLMNLQGRAMLGKSLCRQALGVGFLLLLSGCDVAHNAQRDLGRLLHSDPTSSRPASSQARAAVAPAKPAALPAKADEPKAEPHREVEPVKEATAPANVSPATVSIVGKSEAQVRALLGPPNSVEERAPGKTWRYRDGSCSVDVQLYPDVQTRQFGALAYEVKSDDNTDEGKRGCLAQFRSLAKSRGG
jgi:hypothetical protein